MIQDIYPKIYHCEYQLQKPASHDRILIFFKNTVLIRFQEGKLRYPVYLEMQNFCFHYSYLFSVDNMKYFLALPDDNPQAPFLLSGYQYEDVRIFRTASPGHSAFAGITGYHLFNWYQTNQFCGRCGHAMIPDQKERMLSCPKCRNMVYPRISPAVIVGVINDDKILMSKYAGRSYTNYALIAGFTEIGESAEQTVAREVMEEVGLKVKNIHYYKSQPWAFSGSLLLGYFAQLDGSDQITLDTGELSEAGWFSRDEITLEDDHISLTREMIILFKENKVSFQDAVDPVTFLS